MFTMPVDTTLIDQLSRPAIEQQIIRVNDGVAMLGEIALADKAGIKVIVRIDKPL